MNYSTIVCPLCGTVNENLDLEETRGRMECIKCKRVIRIYHVKVDKTGAPSVISIDSTSNSV